MKIFNGITLHLTLALLTQCSHLFALQSDSLSYKEVYPPNLSPLPLVILGRDTFSHISLNTAMEVCIDSSGNWTVDTLLTKKYDQNFHPANGNVNFGYSDTPLWVRLRLRNESMTIDEWCVSIQYASINSVQCYIMYGDTIIKMMSSGLEVSYNDRILHHQFHVFPIEIQQGQEVTIYFRIYSQYAILVPIEVSSFKDFFSEDRNRTYVLGFLFGALIALLLYNAFLFVTVRDISYLWYCLYAVSFGTYLGARDNLFGQFSFLDHPAVIFYVLALGIGGIIVFGPLFTIEFLQLKKISKTLYRAMIGVVYIGTLYSVVVVLQPLAMSKLLNVVAPLYAISTFFAGIFAWRKGSTVAFLYVVATSILALSILFRILRTTGVVQMNFLSEHGVQIGIVLEMTILSFALGNRINTLREEKEKEKHLIRTQIAQDLHDDVSATLSSIYFYSDVLRQSEKHLSEKGKEILEKVISNLQNAKERLSDIVWSLHSQKETWESLLSKCRRFAEDMFENKKIEYTIEIPKHINAELTAEQKDHLWLIFKEIITNVCRHSQATKAGVTIWEKDNFFHCLISDDGVGLTIESLQRKNGLTNIVKRSEVLRGKATLHSTPHTRTTWVIQIPLA